METLPPRTSSHPQNQPGTRRQKSNKNTNTNTDKIQIQMKYKYREVLLLSKQ